MTVQRADGLVFLIDPVNWLATVLRSFCLP